MLHKRGKGPTYFWSKPTDSDEDEGESDDDDEEGEEDETPSDVLFGENLRDDLEKVFKGDFDFEGKFAFSETFASAPLPGLHIQGVGLVGFPLAQRDAKLIEAAATQAPFGKGTQTVVDTTVRNTFEINPDKLSFKNPAWTEFLQSVIKKVAHGLGLPPNLPPPKANLHKLLIYNTGSHFLPHKDTEKSHGMFGSLIIVLPSKFEGGQVHVSHGGEKDVFDISPSSEFTTSALAWYTDVTHEVKPVTSGYRLALAYNLLYTLPGLPPPHLQDTHSAVSNVEHVFRQWTTGAYNLSRSNPIVYLLDHEYSDVSLQFTALKGKDATLVSNIRPVAENQAISLRLGLLECSVHGDADEYARSPRMEVVHDTRYSIKGLYDLEGDLVSGNGITIRPESDMIPQDPGFDTQDPDDEDFEGYTGNEGAPITYWYRRSVLLMYLAKDDFKTSLQIGGADYALKKLERWRAEGSTERNKQTARFLLNNARFGNKYSQELTPHGSLLLDLALEWGDLPMWKEVIKKAGSKPRLGSDLLLRAWTVFTFDPIINLIQHAIHNQRTTKAAIEFINAFRPRVPTQDSDAVAWWKKQTAAVLSSIEKPSADDVQMFVGVANSEGLYFFSQTILKQLVEFRQLFVFWVNLAKALWKNRKNLVPSGATPEVTSTHIAILNHIIDPLIDAAISEYDPGAAPADPHHYHHPTSHSSSQNYSRVLQLLDLMAFTHRTHHSARLIASATKPERDLLAEYQKSIIPFVPELKLRYQQYSSSEFPMLDSLLRAFVERWLQDILGTPSNRPDAVVKKIDCPCQDCARVNLFLRSDAVTNTFRAAKQRRFHVQDAIRSSIPEAVTCTTIATGLPHGLQITKVQAAFPMYQWNVRLASTSAFLSLVGSPEPLTRIMGDRYQDLKAAIAGTKLYKIREPVPVVPPVQNVPVASTSGARAGASGTQTAPVMAGTKRKAEDDDDDDDDHHLEEEDEAVIDLTSD